MLKLRALTLELAIRNVVSPYAIQKFAVCWKQGLKAVPGDQLIAKIRNEFHRLNAHA